MSHTVWHENKYGGTFEYNWNETDPFCLQNSIMLFIYDFYIKNNENNLQYKVTAVLRAISCKM